jgi:hypothetical protein
MARQFAAKCAARLSHQQLRTTGIAHFHSREETQVRQPRSASESWRFNKARHHVAACLFHGSVQVGAGSGKRLEKLGTVVCHPAIRFEENNKNVAAPAQRHCRREQR